MGWRLCPLSALVKSSRWPENDSQRYQTLTAVIKPFLMETIGEKLLKSISIHVRSNTNSNDGCQGTSFTGGHVILVPPMILVFRGSKPNHSQ